MGKIAAIGLLAVCACVTTPVKQDPAKEKVVLYSSPGAPPPEGKIICHMERPTGSNIPERICRYQNQNDWSSARTQDMMRQIQHEFPCSDTGCAGNPYGVK